MRSQITSARPGKQCGKAIDDVFHTMQTPQARIRRTRLSNEATNCDSFTSKTKRQILTAWDDLQPRSVPMLVRQHRACLKPLTEALVRTLECRFMQATCAVCQYATAAFARPTLRGWVRLKIVDDCRLTSLFASASKGRSPLMSKNL
jgi:hypothetical protein